MKFKGYQVICLWTELFNDSLPTETVYWLGLRRYQVMGFSQDIDWNAFPLPIVIGIGSACPAFGREG
jgi:hypothetical protein